LRGHAYGSCQENGALTSRM